MSAILLVVGLVGVFGAVGVGGWYFSEHQRRLRELREVDVIKIADVVAGDVVRIVGVLRHEGELLRAPLSGRACVHFDVRVSELVSRGKHSSWVERFSEIGSRPFVIEDESGRALVETTRFVCAIVRDANRRSGTFQDATPEMEALLSRHAMDSTGFLGLNRSLRYEEGVLEPGERVTVLGRARWEDDPDRVEADRGRGGYRTSARRRRLVIEAGVRPVRASDDPAAVER